MRDIGFDFYWDDSYTKNIVARGFEFNENIKNIELITTFESFEHFVNPIEEIEKMLKISRNILFTTTLLPKMIPKPDEWWYYAPKYGQHISFYSINTLKFISEKFNLNLYTNQFETHLFTEKTIDQSLFKKLLNEKNVEKNFKIVSKKMKSKTQEDFLKF